MAQKKRSSLALVGQALIQDLQQQGRYERALMRFKPDDDLPRVLSPLDGAHSRRVMAQDGSA